MNPTPALIGWYSLKQHQTLTESAARGDRRASSFIYETPDGRTVTATDVAPEGYKPPWDDAVCLGEVTRFLGDGGPLRQMPVVSR